MERAVDFYGGGLGDRLIDPACFSSTIRQFLQSERDILGSRASSIDLLVEVGCMHGRYLSWAMAHGKRYIGLDVVLRYIEAGRKNLKEIKASTQANQFILGGAEEIHKLIRLNELQVEPEKCLLFFPFNSFGNIRDIISVIKSIRDSEVPFLISPYNTTIKANKSRTQYYKKCGYRDLLMSQSAHGVCFTSSDGLYSMAYHPKFLKCLFHSHGLAIVEAPFSRIGMVYGVRGTISPGITRTLVKQREEG